MEEDSSEVRQRGRRGPVPGTPRRPRMARAEGEAQLIAIAEEIFGRVGYVGTTMEAVAEAAGITKPVIYDIFGSKEGLLDAILAKARRELTDALQQAWAAADPDSGVEGMHRAGLIAFFRYMDDHASAWQWVVEDQGGSGRQGPLDEVRALMVRSVTGALMGQPTLRGIPPIVVEGVAEAIIGACERVATWRVGQPQITAEVASELIMTLTWGGLQNAVTTDAAVTVMPQPLMQLVG